MRCSILTILLTFDAKAHGKEPPMHHPSNEQDLVDQVGNKLVGRALKTQPLRRTNVDDATLLKMHPHTSYGTTYARSTFRAPHFLFGAARPSFPSTHALSQGESQKSQQLPQVSPEKLQPMVENIAANIDGLGTDDLQGVMEAAEKMAAESVRDMLAEGEVEKERMIKEAQQNLILERQKEMDKGDAQLAKLDKAERESVELAQKNVRTQAQIKEATAKMQIEVAKAAESSALGAAVASAFGVIFQVIGGAAAGGLLMSYFEQDFSEGAAAATALAVALARSKNARENYSIYEETKAETAATTKVAARIQAEALEELAEIEKKYPNLKATMEREFPTEKPPTGGFFGR